MFGDDAAPTIEKKMIQYKMNAGQQKSSNHLCSLPEMNPTLPSSCVSKVFY